MAVDATGGDLPILEIRDLTIWRNGRPVLHDASFTVGRGQIHLLVGPNGAGKSSLFGAILGQLDFAGSIRFHWRGFGRIGYVPQAFSVDRTLPLSVGEFLALSRQRRPVCLGIGRRRRRKSDEALSRVGLWKFSGRPLGGLSGGELQRVLLANAIDPVPELLLLDEPASGVDESAVQQLEETLRELSASGQTSILMVSHDLSQARRLAGELTLIDQGRLHSGSPETLLASSLAESLERSAGLRVRE